MDVAGVAPAFDFVFDLTFTLNEQADWFPHASVAVQLTVVLPTGNAEPEGGVQTGVTVPEQVSVAVTVSLPAPDVSPGAATVVSLSGEHVIVGGVLSTRVA